MSKYTIEVRDEWGWSTRKLETSTEATGFRMEPPTFGDRAAAEEHVETLVGAGWGRDALRVREVAS